MATPGSAFICASCARALRRASKPSITGQQAMFRSSARFNADTGVVPLEDRTQIPRWKQTPPAMKMAFRVRPVPNQRIWKVSENPDMLDEAMDSFIGDSAGRGVRGRDVLPEEVKWLSITHKSFEQGARGHNDRLAFFGKRILELLVSKALVDAPATRSYSEKEGMEVGARIGPLHKHPALKGVENITLSTKRTVLSPRQLHDLARSYNFARVVRWVPKKVDDMAASGMDTVMAHALCAVIGAIALQRGGKVANDVAKERVLKPLGLFVGAAT